MYDLWRSPRRGDCGTFQYPPAFLAFLAPMALLPPDAATWTFIGLSIACLVAAVALMPGTFEVRLITLALAGTSWPMLFAIKVGAVGTRCCSSCMRWRGGGGIVRVPWRPERSSWGRW